MTRAGGAGPAAGGSEPERRASFRRWRDPSVLSAAGLAAASGFAQFGVTAALGDVAAAFGEPQPEIGLGERPGLSGTTLGVGLSVIRGASLGALLLAGLADRLGRRRVVIACAALGLGLTLGGAFSPGFWWFVAILAMARPLLSATNAITGVIAAEHTGSGDRSKAVALIGAAYGVGAGAVAIVRGVAAEQLGFRGLFALALVPLALVPLIVRRLEEPERYERLRARSEGAPRPFGSVPSVVRSRLALVALLAGAGAFVAGPANTFLFYYAESVQGMSPSTLALAVLAAGPLGLAGLIAGRWAADTMGRRPAAGAALAAGAAAAVVIYNGGPPGVIAGYLATIFAGSAYTPAAGAIAAELFPTSVRSTAAGWVTAAGVLGAVAGLSLFGVLIDALEGFGAASWSVAVPVMLLSALYFRLPETRGMELEESAPEPPGEAEP